jgi:plasmid maintenance system antidote protein VapI
MTKLGTVIRARLQELSKTQGWLADELGVSNNAVSKWIATGKISRENSIAAAKVLDMSVEALLGEEMRHDARREDSADEMLRRAAEMIEIYRLAGPADRDRIDIAFSEARNNLGAVDQLQPRTR